MQVSTNFLGSRARLDPDKLAVGQTGKFYVKISKILLVKV